jgi:hypothetical protein
MTTDVRLREDAREIWWACRARPLTPEERKNLIMALGDIETTLRADEDAQRDERTKEAA